MNESGAHSAHAQLRAIPTRYAGCHFRSRLEARWAVFFDAMKWQWDYEPQGFELPSGRYLPDFRVSGFVFAPEFFEVKGMFPSDNERMLAIELALQSGMWVSFLGAIPRSAFYTQSGSGALPVPVVPICPCHGDPSGSHQNPDRVIPTGESHAFTQRALDAARSARFEHGHSGAS